MKKHTRATPAGVPRSRSKYTRRERGYGWRDSWLGGTIGERRDLEVYIARRSLSFEFPTDARLSFVFLKTATTPPA